MKFRRQGDLAFLETALIGLGVLILVVMFVPATWTEIEHRNRIQALGETQRIAAGLLHYRRDIGKFPEQTPEGQPLDFLKTTDPCPSDKRWTSGVGESLTAYLVQAPHGMPEWKGPYIQKASLDPWGHAYIVNAKGLREGSGDKAWVLSAGPDGRFDTLPGEGRTSGDDVGVLTN